MLGRSATAKKKKYCTYNVTLKRVRVTIFAVEKGVHILSMCLQP